MILSGDTVHVSFPRPKLATAMRVSIYPALVTRQDEDYTQTADNAGRGITSDWAN